MNADIDPTFPCCELPAPPELANACTGEESLDNPASCTPSGTVATHQLTFMELIGDCNEGYDLDDCDGTICTAGGLAPGEGMNGVDNAVAGLGPTLEVIDANLDGVNQAFSDALCGVGGPECADDVTLWSLRFAVDANLEEGCAIVDVLDGETKTSSVLLNLGAPDTAGNVCVSGALGDIPIKISGEEGMLNNALLRMTLAPTEGFSEGRLGATVDGDIAVGIARSIDPDAAPVVSQIFDIRTDLEPGGRCDAVSGAYMIGGVVVD
jgi:hypothetical protein